MPASSCPLAVLRHEHTAGRTLVSDLTKLAATQTDDSFRQEHTSSILQKLVKLYVEHMWKEDYLLIPMSGKVLSAEDDEVLLREFQEIDRAFGNADRERFERFANTLQHQFVTREAK